VLAAVAAIAVCAYANNSWCGIECKPPLMDGMKTQDAAGEIIVQEPVRLSCKHLLLLLRFAGKI
jgi:hypothetical protein